MNDRTIIHTDTTNTLAPVSNGNVSVATVRITIRCACYRDITIDDLKAIAVGSARHLDKFIEPINNIFKDYQIKSCLQKSHFLAQIFLESSELKLLEENNISPEYERSHYRGYKGRGLLQLTLPEPYQAYSNYKKMDFMGENRLKLSQPFYAVDSAAWFYTKFKNYDLNQVALKNDLIGISAVVNGGFNGYELNGGSPKEGRKPYLLRAFDTLKVRLCDTTPKEVLSTLEAFNFEKSIAFNMIGESFGWGLWHDTAKTGNKGCIKNDLEALKGYKRFLELSQNKRFKSRYGVSFDQAVLFSKQRLNSIK